LTKSTGRGLLADESNIPATFLQYTTEKSGVSWRSYHVMTWQGCWKHRECKLILVKERLGTTHVVVFVGRELIGFFGGVGSGLVRANAEATTWEHPGKTLKTEKQIKLQPACYFEDH
jgi:hypothetical protein